MGDGPCITEDILASLFPGTDADTLRAWVEPLADVCDAFDIDTPRRMAGFLAQVGHESGGLTVTRENLNYSAQGLRRVFPKYFPTDAKAQSYARQPQRIANLVYGNRMGNGPESSGDGYRFCGRGLIQITGRDNYARFARVMEMTVAEAVPYMETREGAAMSAGWFWNANTINGHADADDILGMTRRINGGTNGLEERTALYRQAKALLGDAAGR